MLTTVVIVGIIIALAFDFLNGMNDSANSIATIVSTRVLSPFAAVLWAAFFNFAAVFIFGTHIADTVGKGIINPDLVNEYFILAALIGAVIWVYICTKFGLPISVSHALIGGLIGPALFFYGPSALVSSGIIKIALFIVLSPLIGFVLAYFIMILTMIVFRRVAPLKVDHWFRYMQLFSSAIFSLGHGGNDAQKTMGIITILLYTSGALSSTEVPTWVIYACYITISLGTLTGGWKVIRTLGNGLTDLKPVQGFCAETAGAFTLMGTALLGIPVSTTHTITGSIVGVGITRRFSAVRWGTASHIVAAWVLSIPAALIVSALVYWIINFFI